MKLKEIKYAAFDLDGTLLDEKGRLFEGVKQGIELIVKNAITPIIITGRTYNSFCSLDLEKTFLNMFDDVVLLNDGNVSFHRKKELLTIKNKLSNKLFPYLYQIYKGNAEFVVEADGKHYASSRQAILKYSMIYMIPRKYMHLVDLDKEILEGITNIFVFPQKKIDLSKLTEQFTCNISDIDFLNAMVITPCNSCKGVALEYHLREYFAEKNLQHVIAFGDGYNDCIMLRNCKVGVAVQRSHEAAIEHSNFHLDQPIGEFLYKIFS
ncbi:MULTISPECIES: HAD-IIB family hydrolase [Bacillus]|uniref:HAD-IIB family hydrolase n=1 Tax=Bacillus TaxID=1386 RepID=UPI000D44156A|nr:MULTISPECIES: HAD-IIB family hydrolase [Bacillus]PRP92081.1 phosphoglycolate phosphatase [Bacillus sp. M21]